MNRAVNILILKFVGRILNLISMSKLYLLPLLLAGALTVQAAEREISSFKNEYTTQGKSVNIGGKEYS